VDWANDWQLSVSVTQWPNVAYDESVVPQ